MTVFGDLGHLCHPHHAGGPRRHRVVRGSARGAPRVVQSRLGAGRGGDRPGAAGLRGVRGRSTRPRRRPKRGEAARARARGCLRAPLGGVVQLDEALATHPTLGELRRAVLHGRMPSDEKDAVMQSFARGDIDLLLATTVIEVGVDVPNASTMIVLDADRFGVSQHAPVARASRSRRRSPGSASS